MPLINNFIKALTSTTTTTTTAADGDLTETFIKLGLGLAIGLVISIVYLFCNRRNASSSFAVSVVILPAIVAVVIMMIGSSVAMALSIGGIFSLIRFRSIPGDSKDITTVFFASAAGLTVGLGFYGAAFAITVCISLVMILIAITSYGKQKMTSAKLKISVPENLDFNGVFDEIIKKYAKEYKLEQIRTSNMGTVYELTYSLRNAENVDVKALIDDIRVKNGNLNVIYNGHPEDKQAGTVL